MKQFDKIFRFELGGYLKNKVFVGVTLFLILLVAVVMFFPRVTQMLRDENGAVRPSDAPVTDEVGDEISGDLPVMLVKTDGEEQGGLTQETLVTAFAMAFADYKVVVTELDIDNIRSKITSGEAECAFVMSGATAYTYYVGNLSMYDMNTAIADELLGRVYKVNAMIESGMTPEQADEVMSVQIESNTETLGADQFQNFFYTYIMIFALYMVILLYGQMVATNVATEKSSRAMEVLITSAKPAAMMFGKVFASCTAGLLQLVAVFGSSLLFFNLNRSYWGENQIVNSIFDMPPSLVGYMLIFFVLGFLVYAFLYGAVGSTASKLEDINTSVMPITMLFIAGFFVVIFSMTSGSVDNTLMTVCSYIPFTSPMAMFTRICMSVVPWYEVVISIAVLIGSVVGIGAISAKIYRVGVLMYGTPMKLGAIIKSIRKA